MKQTFRLMLYALLLFVAGACTRHKIIPDEELAQIFRDSFLANAYFDNSAQRADSLNIYEPIFARYGYTTADVQYTIGNFSKRKSARLGDVVELAIGMLERDGSYYNKEVAVLDTINNVARRLIKRSVIADTLITVKSLRDTSRLKFWVDVIPGEYTVRMRYKVDSLDKNEQGIRALVWLEKRDSTRSGNYYTTLRRDQEDFFTRNFIADSTHRRLRVDLLNFSGKPLRPSVTVRDFVVEYIPETHVAVDSLYLRQLNIRIFADEFLRVVNPKDSL